MKIKKINNLGLISGLMTLGYSPIERVKEGKTVTFMFESDDEFENLCKDYFNGRLNVDAQTYHMTLKAVKSSIYEMGK